MSTVAEQNCLRAVAQLLGRLLLRELTIEDLEILSRSESAAALKSMGMTLPVPSEQDSWLEQRAAEYHDYFLRPESGPLVESLWKQGRYEGDATVRIRQLADFAGAQFERAEARGAPQDHLGSLLLLWGTTDGKVQEVADEIAREHLGWAEEPLEQVAATSGFYAALGKATLLLLETIQLPALDHS
ncbi:MAG: TorA maturation chaperone TorD [Planctomycetota bacterium]|jgi:TorA maturation chaperone TorD